MKQKKKHRPTDETLSWKELLRLYRKIRIPWGMLILVGGFSLLIKQAQLWLVPYTSKIMTGAITEHGFIAGFVGFTLLYTLVEALQGGINELTGQITQRNVRHTVWNRILRLPMSYFGDQDRQGLVSRVTQDTTGTYAAIAAMIQLISVVYGTVSLLIGKCEPTSPAVLPPGTAPVVPISLPRRWAKEISLPTALWPTLRKRISNKTKQAVTLLGVAACFLRTERCSLQRIIKEKR